MAFSHDFDPANGFVALPSDVMDIEMSPGAFRLLVELCRMANRSGECWPSLAQLSDRIGRSKAAISGYITELREIELLQTASQKMANGYNYRLKYCVTFWQSWRAQLAQPTQKKVAQKTKRCIQPSERRVNSKNNIHKNNSPETKTAEITKLESVFLEWTKLSKAAPFPSFNDTVPVELIEETKDLIQLQPIKTLSQSALSKRLFELWKLLNVQIDKDDVHQQSAMLVKRNTTEQGFQSLQDTALEVWQKHWRKPPTLKQFEEILTKSSDKNRAEGMLRMLEQYLRRLEIAENKLHHSTHSNNVLKKQAA